MNPEENFISLHIFESEKLNITKQTTTLLHVMYVVHINVPQPAQPKSLVVTDGYRRLPGARLGREGQDLASSFVDIPHRQPLGSGLERQVRVLSTLCLCGHGQSLIPGGSEGDTGRFHHMQGMLCN